LLLIIAAVSIVTGCRSAKNLQESDTSKTWDPKLGLISIIEQKSERFHTMKARKVNLEFSMNGVSEHVNGNIAIYRDSIIAVSIIPALGYEVLRILCTEDSVIIINRPDKSFTSSSFEYFQKRYKMPVGFRDLQAILANEVFYFKEDYGDRIFKKELKESEESNMFIVDAFREGNRITNQRIEIDSEGRKLENVIIVDYDVPMKIGLNYLEFIDIEEILFPRAIKVELVERNTVLKLELQYGQIIFNDSLNVSFSVPAHYTRTGI